MKHQPLLEVVGQLKSKMSLLIALRLKSLKRPIVLMFLLCEPIVLGVLGTRSVGTESFNSDGSLVGLLVLALQISVLLLPFQAGISAVFLVDALGGETKQKIDLTLLSTIPVKQNELLTADYLLGLCITQLQLLILDIVIILAVPITKYPIIMLQGIIILGLAFFLVAILIVSLTTMLIETMSSALAYFAAPLVFISWRMIIFGLSANLEMGWIVFVEPSTIVESLTIVLLGREGSFLSNMLYSSNPLVVEYLSIANNIIFGIIIITLIITFVLRSHRGYRM
ncbi:MAG: hypothetical protein ACTSYL_05400 [Candidatus Thorarchaeota archaeon]